MLQFSLFFFFFAVAVRLYVGGKNQKKGSAPGKQGSAKKRFRLGWGWARGCFALRRRWAEPPRPRCRGSSAGFVASCCKTPWCLTGRSAQVRGWHRSSHVRHSCKAFQAGVRLGQSACERRCHNARGHLSGATAGLCIGWLFGAEMSRFPPEVCHQQGQRRHKT